MTTPHGLSRSPTSFIGAWYQGIHRMPLLLGHHRYTMLAHTIHKSNTQPHTQPQPTPTPARTAPAPTEPNTTAPRHQPENHSIRPATTGPAAPTETSTVFVGVATRSTPHSGCSLRHPTARSSQPHSTTHKQHHSHKLCSSPTPLSQPGANSTRVGSTTLSHPPQTTINTGAGTSSLERR